MVITSRLVAYVLGSLAVVPVVLCWQSGMEGQRFIKAGPVIVKSSENNCSRCSPSASRLEFIRTSSSPGHVSGTLGIRPFRAKTKRLYQKDPEQRLLTHALTRGGTTAVTKRTVPSLSRREST